MSILDSLPKIKVLVAWGVQELPEKYRNDNRFYTWGDFLNIGKDVPDSQIYKLIEN